MYIYMDKYNFCFIFILQWIWRMGKTHKRFWEKTLGKGTLSVLCGNFEKIRYYANTTTRFRLIFFMRRLLQITWRHYVL